MRRGFKPRKPGPLPSRSVIMAHLAGALRDVAAEGVRQMAEYPQAPPGQVYVRTGTLKRSWSFDKPRVEGNRITSEIGSNASIAPYNEQVQGERQKPFFRARNWRNIEDLQKVIDEKLPAAAQKAMDDAFKLTRS